MATRIGWTDETWNPSVGCERISPGCTNCYAIGVAHRAMQPAHVGLTVNRPGSGVGWTGEVRCLPDRLDVPRRWTRPRRVFVNSMSDLGHPLIPVEFFEDVMDVMGDCRQHQFQVLTKRPRVLALRLHSYYDCDHGGAPYSGSCPYCAPFPNVWIGTSVESARYVWRVDWLRDAPAAVRFVSWEPMLGPLAPEHVEGVDWLILGGESGPRARPLDVGWVREGIAICRDLGIACFVKQLGTAWADANGHGRTNGDDPAQWPEDLRVQEWPRQLVPA